ncbi:M10 family metallopeptidase C-terminal domain-containing protein [Synechocystis sp. LEGE 06083]|uniref:calcium-binding protein n=1 Tax=Synechocystis sp. LEGE 06083 TaxID=915336 RepID=UPI00187FF8C4|nr:calcium-binding protein [Synechocystis sp. LEGE 06083]MBE9197187.1 M10 family metallopeptidase C-terminal domain-containing protein [Synechocystis sp. LEGE 06083]
MAIINGTPQNDNNTGASFGGFLGLVLQTKNFRPALIGTLGDDSIFGDAGTDILVGLTGDDLLDGGTGADTMFGGFGDDTYIVDNTGDLVGEWLDTDGTDLVESSVTYSLNGSTFSLPGISGLANNTAAALPVIGLGPVDYALYLGLTLLDLTPQFIENLTLTGTDNINGEGNALDNVIIGNDENNVLTGLGGNDTIYGMGGDDTISGGDGDDSILGGDGNDSISGGDGNDFLNGNVGDDFLNGNVGDDTVRGGKGNDTVRGGKGNDSLYGDLGDDSVFGDLDNDTLFGGQGNDTMDGGDDYDTAHYGDLEDSGDQAITLKGTGDLSLTVEKGALGTDTLLNIEEVIANGGADNNTIDFSGAVSPVNVDLSAETLSSPNETDPTFSLAKVINFDDVIGTSGNDSITGDAQDNILRGGGGKDTIFGGDGNDFISGGAEKDLLTGGSDNDLFDYTTLTDSQIGISWFNVNLSKVDVITDFTIGQDKFFVQQVPTDGILPGVRQLSANSIFGLGVTVLGLSTLGAYDAAQITVGSRTFVAINDGSIGFNATKDAFIELTNFTGTLTTSDFTNIFPV